MSTYSVSGTFESSDAALDAGEKLREVAGEEATIHLLLPGRQMVEADIKTTSGDWQRLAVVGFAIGLVGAYVFLTLFRGGFTLGVVGVAVGVIAGGLLGVWLSGERVEARLGELRPGSRTTSALQKGRAVVSATVGSRKLAERVREALEGCEGFIESETQPPRARIEATA